MLTFHWLLFWRVRQEVYAVTETLRQCRLYWIMLCAEVVRVSPLCCPVCIDYRPSVHTAAVSLCVCLTGQGSLVVNSLNRDTSCVVSTVREYIFYIFLKIQNATFYVF